MKRLALLRSWKRLGLQFGLLAGLGLAFVGGSQSPARADGECPVGNQCTFKKPNFMIVMDYSSSMNEPFAPGQTRWEAAVEAVQSVITTNNGFFDESMHISLMRYGHDPSPAPGTTIPNDPSGLVDGQSLDVHWYDPENAPDDYFECNGQAIVDFLNDVEPPLCQGLTCAGIGTWTEGALLRAQEVIAQTRGDHPDDVAPGDERYYAVLLMTDGLWSSQNGQEQGLPSEDSPVPVAGDLFSNDDVPVYVVAFGDAAGESFADDIATAGGTQQAINAGAGQLVPALEQVVEDIEDQVIIPECTGGLPRVMVILDASSSMLNVDDVAGPMGQTGWDQARQALAGSNSIFDALISGVNNQPVEDLVHLGLITFGSEDPVAEEALLVNYGPCMKDNFEWALDPQTSCGPGCSDPWSGPPILWSFQGPTSPSYPGFDAFTYSRMPSCDVGQFTPGACTGSGTATHRGLQLAAENAAAYRANPPELYALDAGTTFVNILITDGQYEHWSTDEQVSAALRGMYENDGIRTYVIGMGDAISETELANMACWGSGGTGIPCTGGQTSHFLSSTQAQLEAALQQIIDDIDFDPCCGFNDCSFNPEPTTNEPDPIPPITTGELSAGSSTGDETTDSSSSGTDGTNDGGSGDPGSSDDAGESSGSATAGGEGDGGSGPLPTTAGADESTGGETAGEVGEDIAGCGCTTGRRSRDLGSVLFMFVVAGVLRRRR